MFEETWEEGPYGGTSNCYFSKTDSGVFLKLFHDNIPFELLEKEFNIAKKIYSFGKNINSRPIELVNINGKTGIVYEKIPGNTVADLLKKSKKKADEYAKLFGQEARKIHSTKFDLTEFESARENLSASVDAVFPSKKINKTLHLVLDAMNEKYKDDVLLHGDLHPGNIMLSDLGCIWIDMGYASKGPYIFDLTAMDMMMNFPITYLFTKNPYGLNALEAKRFYTRFLETYFNTTDKNEIKLWKKRIRLCTTLYTTEIVYKENWQGIAKYGMKLLIAIFTIYGRKYL